MSEKIENIMEEIDGYIAKISEIQELHLEDLRELKKLVSELSDESRLFFASGWGNKEE